MEKEGRTGVKKSKTWTQQLPTSQFRKKKSVGNRPFGAALEKQVNGGIKKYVREPNPYWGLLSYQLSERVPPEKEMATDWGLCGWGKGRTSGPNGYQMEGAPATVKGTHNTI